MFQWLAQWSDDGAEGVGFTKFDRHPRRPPLSLLLGTLRLFLGSLGSSLLNLRILGFCT
jgi:hypothetical protein